VAEGVERNGPYLDVIRGRTAYVAYLEQVLPTLENYRLEVSRVRALEGGGTIVELCEILDVDGVATRFPEAIFFDFDADGLIATIDIYLKQPPPQ
jgi:hypothetical protein